MSNAVKEGRLSRRISSIIRSFEKQGFDITRLIEKSIKNLEQQRFTLMMTDEKELLKQVEGRLKVMKDIQTAYEQGGKDSLS